jgi:hypothetical protein
MNRTLSLAALSLSVCTLALGACSEPLDPQVARS